MRKILHKKFQITVYMYSMTTFSVHLNHLHMHSHAWNKHMHSHTFKVQKLITSLTWIIKLSFSLCNWSLCSSITCFSSSLADCWAEIAASCATDWLRAVDLRISVSSLNETAHKELECSLCTHLLLSKYCMHGSFEVSKINTALGITHSRANEWF